MYKIFSPSKMFISSNVHDCYQKLLNSELTWMILHIKENLEIYESGDGDLQEFLQEFPTEKVAFGFCRVQKMDLKKFILVNYCPSSISGQQRLKFMQNIQSISDHFIAHAQITARDEEDLNIRNIYLKLGIEEKSILSGMDTETDGNQGENNVGIKDAHPQKIPDAKEQLSRNLTSLKAHVVSTNIPITNKRGETNEYKEIYKTDGKRKDKPLKIDLVQRGVKDHKDYNLAPTMNHKNKAVVAPPPLPDRSEIKPIPKEFLELTKELVIEKQKPSVNSPAIGHDQVLENSETPMESKQEYPKDKNQINKTENIVHEDKIPEKQINFEKSIYGRIIYEYSGDKFKFIPGDRIQILEIQNDWTDVRKDNETDKVPTAYYEKEFTATALYNFQATEQEELTIKEGENLFDVYQVSDEWWFGQSNSGKGIFPASYARKQ